jgi:hypothetical protein
MIPESEGTLSLSSSRVVLDQVDVAFDDDSSVAGAGLLLDKRPEQDYQYRKAPEGM